MAYFASQEKRKAEESALVHVKKPRNELLGYSDAGKRLQLAEVGRTSSLEAPIMLLTGHLGELYCGKFHPDGTYLATSGFDRQIFFWNTLGECENFAVLSGHTGAVLDMHFSTDGGLLFTASTDKTLGVWDTRVGVRIKRLRGHSLYVNCCHPARRGPQLLCSGGDDSTLKLWDTRKRTPAHSFQESYQITAVSFNDTAEQVLSGGHRQPHQGLGPAQECRAVPHGRAPGHRDRDVPESGWLLPALQLYGQHLANLGRAALCTPGEVRQDPPRSPAQL
ncbi:unnamed protein product [Ixodes pacificus]